MPCSTTWPSFRTMIRSAKRKKKGGDRDDEYQRERIRSKKGKKSHKPDSTMVFSLCAIKMLVWALSNNAVLTFFMSSDSVCESRAEVLKEKKISMRELKPDKKNLPLHQRKES